MKIRYALMHIGEKKNLISCPVQYTYVCMYVCMYIRFSAIEVSWR
jgi:hypothetical protein